MNNINQVKEILSNRIQLVKNELEKNTNYLIDECNKLIWLDIWYYKGKSMKNLTHVSIEIFEEFYDFWLYPMDQLNSQIWEYKPFLEKFQFDISSNEDFRIDENLSSIEDKNINELINTFFENKDTLVLEWFSNWFNKSDLKNNWIKYRVSVHDSWREIHLN